MIHWFFTYWTSLQKLLKNPSGIEASGPELWLLSAQSIFPLQIPSDYTGVISITNRKYAQLEGKNLKLTIHLHWLIPSKMGPIEQQPLVFYSRNSSTSNKPSNFTTTSPIQDLPMTQWPSHQETTRFDFPHVLGCHLLSRWYGWPRDAYQHKWRHQWASPTTRLQSWP